MKIKMIINTQKAEDGALRFRSSQVWEGELEIHDENEYLVKISIIGEGQPQPICDIPFSLGRGYYMWIPPDTETDENMGDIDAV